MFAKLDLSRIPKGAGVLFFIQVFATLGFAVLYSTLVLYATSHLGFPAKDATAIFGVFAGFNYGLHMFGGYLGGRFLSNRNLFVGGMVLQVFGCASIAGGTLGLFYVGLALFLTGSGLNVTCINMMLTQRFKPDDTRREGAFLWNYAGMNLGFFVGFSAAGHYQLTENYPALFIFATLGNIAAIVIAAAFWKTLADSNTPLVENTDARAFRHKFAAGVAILVGLVPVIWILLQHPHGTETLVKGICALVGLALVWLTVRHPDARERNNMWAYLILALGSLVFWALYQMAPAGLQLFAVNNVERHVWGREIAPQWIQNINTVVIVLGGPLMSALFARLRARGWNIDIPRQFAASLVLMGFGFLALPAGIVLAHGGMVAFFWLFASYVFQSVGELLISPIGYAMIGKLAPKKYQGVMMGAWMLVTGLASLFAGDFSGMVPEPSEGGTAASNPVYARLFTELGCGSLVVGVVLAVLVPSLRRLIKDEEAAVATDAVVVTAGGQ